MAWGDDDSGSRIARRGSGVGGALGQLLPGVTIHTARGASTIPGKDMQIYEQMAQAIQGLEALAASMNELDQKDDETRALMRKMRVLAVELRGEVERRVG